MEKSLGSPLGCYFPTVFKLRGFMNCPYITRELPSNHLKEMVPSLFPSKSEHFYGLWSEILFLFYLHLFTISCVVKTSHFKTMQLQLLFQN